MMAKRSSEWAGFHTRGGRELFVLDGTGASGSAVMQDFVGQNIRVARSEAPATELRAPSRDDSVCGTRRRKLCSSDIIAAELGRVGERFRARSALERRESATRTRLAPKHLDPKVKSRRSMRSAQESTQETSEKTKSPLISGPSSNFSTFVKIWSGRRGSNPRPRPWQGRALPLSYTRIRDGGDRSPSTAELCQMPTVNATVRTRPGTIGIIRFP